MKKAITIVLCLIMIPALCSCKKAEYDTFKGEDDSSTKETYNNHTNKLPEDKQDNFDQEQDEYESVISYCEECIVKGDYSEALKYSKRKAEENARYLTVYNEYADLFIVNSLEKAQDFAKKRDFASAIQILEAANSEYNCSEFSSMIEDYQEHLPRKLIECHILDSDNYSELEQATDCFGEIYTDSFGFETGKGDGAFPDWYFDGFVVYFLDGKFENLSGIFAVNNNIQFSDTSTMCKIYGDGKLLYESIELVGRTAYPININVDITGVKQLRIEGTVQHISGTRMCKEICDFTVS